MLYETKQQGKPVNDYFTKMQVLWEELDDLTVHPPLTVEEQKLFQFLNGLDDINGAVRSNLLMRTPLPTVEEACNAVSQEESQREVLKPVKEEHEGLVMYGSGAGTSSQPEKCSVCGKLGHTAVECWYVKGFPTGYNRKGKGKEQEQVTSYRGGRGGRYNRGGRFNRGGRGMAANVHNQRGSSHHQSKESKEEKTAVVTHKGNAHLNENIKLKNVMLAPSFHHNLVSIQKLPKDNNLEVKFKESYCLITCANSGEVKGVGIAEKGLYTLVNEPIRTFAKRIKDMQRVGSKDQNTEANAVRKVEVPDVLQNQRNLSKPMLWHHRLGHTPLERIRKIPQ
ncbi:tRNA uridine 5-carboxymethylaminomethyl modification enzyme MnmG, partial [Bienertia sinuspersici]